MTLFISPLLVACTFAEKLMKQHALKLEAVQPAKFPGNIVCPLAQIKALTVVVWPSECARL